jgi:hypothetical protein
VSTITTFAVPAGLNFHCSRPIPVGDLSRDLRKIASFLQQRAPSSPLEQLDDWLQHDGIVFLNRTIDFHQLFQLVGSPRAVYAAVPGDDLVRVAIRPADESWYLRFYAVWMDEDDSPSGNYDVTLPSELALLFRRLVVPVLQADVEEEPSAFYFQRISAK